jgi:membrane protease YdiL (CAAX protease family)
MNHVAERKAGHHFAWFKARLEILAPILGLLLLRAMLNWQNVRLTTGQTILVYGLALVYAALVLWSPMALPAKVPRPATRPELKQIVVKIALLVLAGFAVLAVLSLTSSRASGAGRLGPAGVVLALLLLTGLGTAGLAAERRLPIDLFPVLRRREIPRILYVLVAALFLAVLENVWSGIWGDIAAGIGRALGETPLVDSDAASYFDVGNPLRLFLNFLIGAGLAEEVLFRVGIMTPVWALTGRWGWGLLVSAVIFGLYHISPLSGMAAYNLQAPVTAVLESFGAGLAIGVIYRYRGFMTAVMTHALGNWLVVMILLGT